MNTTWYSHSHLAGLTFVIVHREAPFVCLAAHESGVSAVGDCRKCRTATATPAEPGDLLWMLVWSAGLSLDDFGGAGEQSRRKLEADRSGGLEIDDEVEFGQKADRQL